MPTQTVCRHVSAPQSETEDMLDLPRSDSVCVCGGGKIVQRHACTVEETSENLPPEANENNQEADSGGRANLLSCTGEVSNLFICSSLPRKATAQIGALLQSPLLGWNNFVCFVSGLKLTSPSRWKEPVTSIKRNTAEQRELSLQSHHLGNCFFKNLRKVWCVRPLQQLSADVWNRSRHCSHFKKKKEKRRKKVVLLL